MVPAYSTFARRLSIFISLVAFLAECQVYAEIVTYDQLGFVNPPSTRFYVQSAPINELGFGVNDISIVVDNDTSSGTTKLYTPITPDGLTVQAKDNGHGDIGVYLKSTVAYQGTYPGDAFGRFARAGILRSDYVILAIPVDQYSLNPVSAIDMTFTTRVHANLRIGGAGNGSQGLIYLTASLGNVSQQYSFPEGSASIGSWIQPTDISVTHVVDEQLTATLGMTNSISDDNYKYFTAVLSMGFEAVSSMAIDGHWEQEINAMNTFSLQNILVNGQTPESQGMTLAFASGMLSPNVVAVPEPSTITLIMLASCIFPAYLRSRRG